MISAEDIMLAVKGQEQAEAEMRRVGQEFSRLSDTDRARVTEELITLLQGDTSP